MIVSKIVLRNFRNYDWLELEFDPKMNIIVGDNAQGKTNIVEAIHFLSLARSFRTSNCVDLIKERRQFATIEAQVVENTTHKDIVAIMTNSTKKFTCNGNQIKKISDLSKLINVIVFQPKDALMFNDSPIVRRNYLDINISKKTPIYLENLMQFERLLRERNKILKDEQIDKVQLAVVTEELIDIEEEIVKYRRAYINELNTVLSKIITVIKGEEEVAMLQYEPFINLSGDFHKTCIRAYDKNLDSDIKHKTTQLGIHREDFKILLNGNDISEFGSQGENRIAVIALKLSPFFLIEEREKRPIIVLDDVLSELDKNHQTRLIGFLKKFEQVFITSTNTNVKNTSIYEVKDHKVTRRN